jgi:hypothetical protein
MAYGRHEADHSKTRAAANGTVTRVRPRRLGWLALASASCLLLGLAARQGAHLAGSSQADSSELSCLTGTRLVADTVSTGTTMFGVDASSAGALAQATSEFGHMPVIRVFYPGLPPANAWTSGAAAANRSAIVVSFNALPSAILSGADDAAVTHFFDTAPTGHPIYWSYEHEPEHFIDAGQFTAADYRAAWVHLGALAAAAGNPDLHATLILTSWTLDPSSGRNWRNYYAPGVISVLGWDDYPPGTIGDHNPQATPPAQFMSAEITAARSAGLAVGFPEFALATPAGRPAWLIQVARYLTANDALFGIYFNAPGPGQMNDTSSITTWRQIIAGSGTGIGGHPGPTSSPNPGGRASASPGPTRKSGTTPASTASGSTRPQSSSTPAQSRCSLPGQCQIGKRTAANTLNC